MLNDPLFPASCTARDIKMCLFVSFVHSDSVVLFAGAL